MHTSLKRITFHLGALSSLLKSLTEVLEATLVTRMLNDQIELMNVDGVEIDYLGLNVLEPVLSVEDGLVASARQTVRRRKAFSYLKFGPYLSR